MAAHARSKNEFTEDENEMAQMFWKKRQTVKWTREKGDKTEGHLVGLRNFMAWNIYITKKKKKKKLLTKAALFWNECLCKL